MFPNMCYQNEHTLLLKYGLPHFCENYLMCVFKKIISQYFKLDIYILFKLWIVRTKYQQIYMYLAM